MNKWITTYSNLAYTGMLYALANTLKVSVEDPRAKILAVKAWGVIHGLSHLLIDGQFDALAEVDRENMINQILNTLHVS